MTIENNHPIAFVLIIVGFLIGSRNGNKIRPSIRHKTGYRCLFENKSS